MRLRAALYVRESTERQADGFSPEMQEKAIRRFAAEHGMDVVGVYRDFESGRTDRREAFQELLTSAEASQLDAVLIYHTSRFARNLELSRRLKRHLREKLGVKVISVSQTYDPDTPDGWFFEAASELFDEHYSRTLSFWIARGLREKHEQGELLGPLPVGYARATDGTVIEDPVLAPLVRALFEKYAAGDCSMRDLARMAGDMGLRTPTGKPLDRINIQKILSNPTYAGYSAYKRRAGGHPMLDGKHPTLVPRDVFQTVERTRRERQRSPRAQRGPNLPYPLSGIALCSACDSPMSGAVFVRGEKRQRYMRCRKAARRGREACTQRMVPAELLEGQMSLYIDGFTLPAGYKERLITLYADSRRLDDGAVTRGRIESELERWRQLFVLGDVDRERYQSETNRLRQQLRTLPATAAGSEVDEAAAYLTDMGRLYRDASQPLRRRFLLETIESVTVDHYFVKTITPRQKYAPLFVLDREERFGAHNACHWLPGQDSNLQPIG